MKLAKFLMMLVASFSLAIGSVDTAEAKDKKKGGNKAAKSVPHNAGKGVGKGPKTIPPGQIKRYTRGAKLPGDLRYDSISDLSKWKMKPLKAGEKYIKVDNEILRVSDTMKVLAVVGLVSELAN